MKKYLKIIYILIIVFICITNINISLAETKYTMQGISYTYKGKNVKVKLNGKDVYTDIPPIIHEGRTLIPIRALIESLGGNINWFQETKRVSISLKNTNISMVINNNIARVNNKDIVLDVPPCIAYEESNPQAGRTIVPVRFVMENLGLNVQWDKDTYTVNISSEQIEDEEEINQENQNNITSIKSDIINNKINIEIKTEKEIEYNIIDLKEPNRTVIDIKNGQYTNLNNIVIENRKYR